ncbi:BlaI family transcriptional regulator, penicillinase repressor [Paenibacillus catalpae]|uniref:BlaI family transcriptional regulator, penicillinase repressor n=1 Tax=Paenibacillus catalpae TaxID=1045775 RepID=A0A1I1XSS4_9BACL|nr:BlaI/MecI/CopY family transcriptional regulator [Paenibacillus catalpae]SFE10311.1 BlaI family transcriptional regulator, penicillinase repressor [Paenibacillus catalpae]
MKEMPRISDAEWEVMKVLWAKSPMTAGEVIESLADITDWSPKTIRTLLTRLVQKEVITFDSNSKPYVYSPLVAEEESTRAETQSFLKRLYGGGALKPMLVNFLKYEQLSKEDIQELKSILDERKE